MYLFHSCIFNTLEWCQNYKVLPFIFNKVCSGTPIQGPIPEYRKRTAFFLFRILVSNPCKMKYNGIFIFLFLLLITYEKELLITKYDISVTCCKYCFVCNSVTGTCPF
jgi:hypothetical protein